MSKTWWGGGGQGPFEQCPKLCRFFKVEGFQDLLSSFLHNWPRQRRAEALSSLSLFGFPIEEGETVCLFKQET